MKSDYLSWFQKNEDFFETLFKEDSLIFNHLHDTIKVLNFISNQEKVNEDLEVFYEIGFPYLFNKVNDIKYYVENYFNNNLSKFLKYEILINYTLYLDDLIDSLTEKKLFDNNIKIELSKINEEIDDILRNKKKFDNDLINKYDLVIQSLIPNTQILTIPEIFHRAAEELRL
ncbi:MAG TPA: hypothetical protein GXZ48_05950 [Acholeplasmataceae bacterium]|nr:hypothetical protein [Acholeplasmataceae bacterium]